MENFKSPLLNQIFVASGVLTTILSCGLGLGFLPVFQDSNVKSSNQTYDAEISLNYIETAGELAFIPSILIIPFTMQKKGRRMANILTIMLVLCSWVMSFNARNVISLTIANVLHNVSLGGAVSISSIIISEYCSPKYRGVFLMLETAMISLGVLLCHICGMFSCWKLISFLGVLTSLIALLITYLSPESPYWLVNEGHLVKGTEIFYWLRGQDEDATSELNNLLLSRKIKMQLKSLKPLRSLKLRDRITEYLRSLFTADFLKPLSIMILLFSFVSVGGENLITNFSLRNVFKLNGKYIGTIVLDVLTLICSLTACILIQIVKRKTLFLFTGSFSIVFLGLTSLFLFLQTLDWFLKDYLWLFLCLVTGFVMFMSLGTTALPFTLLGEIFPMSYQGVGSSLTCAYLWAFGNSILKSVPPLTNTLGLHGVLFMVMIMMILILVTLNKIMPDTDFKSLLEIERLMKLQKDGQYHVALNDVEEPEPEQFDDLKLFFAV